MVLARKFTQAEDNDYERLVAAGGRLRALLEALAEERLPPEYDAGKLAKYAESLIATQRMDGSFSSSLSPDSLVADEKTDAHRFVTWVSAALLALLKSRHPEEAATVKGLEESLAAALTSPLAGDFSFPESGPAEPVQQVEAALILASGGIPALLKTSPSLAPGLAAALTALTETFRQRLEKKETDLPGGIDYSSFFLQALTALEG